MSIPIPKESRFLFLDCFWPFFEVFWNILRTFQDFLQPENSLKTLNLKNGNNYNLNQMQAYNNQLNCIQVDDENYAYNQICDQQNYNGWCKDETAIYSEDCQLTTKDFATTDFKLFPNPAQNVLNIQSQEQIDSVRIFTLEGRLLLQTANPSIDISQLKGGLYLVQIRVQGHTATKIFLKN